MYWLSGRGALSAIEDFWRWAVEVLFRCARQSEGMVFEFEVEEIRTTCEQQSTGTSPDFKTEEISTTRRPAQTSFMLQTEEASRQGWMVGCCFFSGYLDTNGNY